MQVNEGNDELTANINLLGSFAHHYNTNKRNTISIWAGKKTGDPRPGPERCQSPLTANEPGQAEHQNEYKLFLQAFSWAFLVLRPGLMAGWKLL